MAAHCYGNHYDCTGACAITSLLQTPSPTVQLGSPNEGEKHTGKGRLSGGEDGERGTGTLPRTKIGPGGHWRKCIALDTTGQDPPVSISEAPGLQTQELSSIPNGAH